MKNAIKQKVGERALLVSILSIGLASLMALLISESFAIVFYGLLGIGSLVLLYVRVQERIANALVTLKGGPLLLSAFGIVLPLFGLLVSGFYAGIMGAGVWIGVPLAISIWVITIGSALLALVNLVFLLVNIVSLLQGSRASVHPMGVGEEDRPSS